jgi:hypothetical protein
MRGFHGNNSICVEGCTMNEFTLFVVSPFPLPYSPAFQCLVGLIILSSCVYMF